MRWYSSAAISCFGPHQPDIARAQSLAAATVRNLTSCTNTTALSWRQKLHNAHCAKWPRVVSDTCRPTRGHFTQRSFMQNFPPWCCTSAPSLFWSVRQGAGNQSVRCAHVFGDDPRPAHPAPPRGSLGRVAARCASRHLGCRQTSETFALLATQWLHGHIPGSLYPVCKRMFS